MSIDIEKCRAQFPALKTGFIFGDNAGGSQILQSVIDKVTDYYLNTNVQLGALYEISIKTTERVDEGPAAAAKLINATSPTEIVFGPSSTMLIENLARSMEADFEDGEEIIITGEHEANVGPWKKLAKRKNLPLKTWEHTRLPNTHSENPYAVGLSLDSLTPLITSKTRLIALTATSNLLGSVVDIPSTISAIRSAAKAAGARKVEICVDCVAYAPHRRIDVQKWDVDYCFFSWYKVYGPHTSTLFVRKSLLTSSLTSLAHHFLPAQGKAYMLSPGGAGYELTYAVTGVIPYLTSLSPSGDLDDAFDRIAKHEAGLIDKLLTYLRSKRDKGVLIVGDEEASPSRVPTICFIVKGKKSKDVVAYFDKRGKVGIRNGHMYAYTLVESLKPPMDIDDAVVRISLVHYNTLEEVGVFIDGLEDILAGQT